MSTAVYVPRGKAAKPGELNSNSWSCERQPPFIATLAFWSSHPHETLAVLWAEGEGDRDPYTVCCCLNLPTEAELGHIFWAPGGEKRLLRVPRLQQHTI